MHQPVRALPPEVIIDEDQAGSYAEIVDGLHARGPRGRIIFCVSTTDLDEGKGDPYVALGLAKYLMDEGWGVSLWPMSQWHETPSPEPTVAIVMVESFIPGMLPQGTATIAWIRNWTENWAALPYLEDFDGIWCSSPQSAELLSTRYSGQVSVMPIGVDSELFRVANPLERTMPVITTANFWGAKRDIQTALTAVSRTTAVTWFGANRQHLVRAASIHHADRVSFFGLPSIYAQSLVVVDDLIEPARAYGNHNSRLFEAIACGAVPVTNTRNGLDELGLGDVPSYDDDESLTATVTSLLADRTALAALAGRLAAVVEQRHTYRARATTAVPLIDAAIARAGKRGPRSEILRWATGERYKLHSAETLRDGHLITVRQLERQQQRMEREIVELRHSLDESNEELRAIRASRLHRFTRRISRFGARVRSTIRRAFR